MKKIALFLILVLLCVIQSCEESPEPGIPINSSFIYPLTVGNRWTYQMSVDYSHIQPDSIKYRLTDFSLEYSDIVTRDTLINSIQLYEMKEESEDFTDSYAYFANETNGFFQYAYRYDQVDTNLAKANANKIFHDQRMQLDDSFLTFRQMNKPLGLSKSANDSIVFFDDPYILYLYPWEIGARWNYSLDPAITKKVIDIVTVKTDAGVYDCYKVQYLYTDVTYLEYIGAAGLIKTVIKYNNMPITSIENPDGIGQADIKIEIELIDVNF